jgi:hypothetical protein
MECTTERSMNDKINMNSTIANVAQVASEKNGVYKM